MDLHWSPGQLILKPGDHPDFFQFPAPAGRSRESTVRIDALGRFWHDGQQVEHDGMNRAFSNWINLHPDDGRFILENGYDWTYFNVDDAPFFVRTLSIRSDVNVPENSVISILLSDGLEEDLKLSTVREGSGDALYCRVKNDKFEAKFTPVAQVALAPLLRETPQGEVLIVHQGKEYVISPR